MSITTLDSGYFNLDAVELVNTTAPLTEGLYEEYNPALIYDTTYEDLIVNGGMERDNDGWSAVTAATHSQSTLRFSGRYSRMVVAADGDGIQSNPFNLTGGTYAISAHVNVYTGATGNVIMRLVNGSGATIAEVTTPAGAVNKWHSLRLDVTGVAENNARVRFITTGGAATFYVDDVKVVSGGQWAAIGSSRYSDGRMMESRVVGSQMQFTFTGNGFEIGTMLDRYGGEVEICYTGTESGCFTYQNENTRTSYTTSRTILGLTTGTYTVTVRDVENGKSAVTKNPDDPRIARYDPALVRIDYVRIYNETLPDVIPDGSLSPTPTG